MGKPVDIGTRALRPRPAACQGSGADLEFSYDVARGTRAKDKSVRGKAEHPVSETTLGSSAIDFLYRRIFMGGVRVVDETHAAMESFFHRAGSAVRANDLACGFLPQLDNADELAQISFSAIYDLRLARPSRDSKN
jgi:hypothetical protein